MASVEFGHQDHYSDKSKRECYVDFMSDGVGIEPNNSGKRTYLIRRHFDTEFEARMWMASHGLKGGFMGRDVELT